MTAKIGKEKARLVGKSCLVTAIKIVEVPANEKMTEEKQKVVFVLKHPDREEPLELSTVKFEKDGKVKQTATWLTLDEDECISYESSLAYLMRHYEVEEYEQLVGKKMTTTIGDNGFLVIKAY